MCRRFEIALGEGGLRSFAVLVGWQCMNSVPTDIYFWNVYFPPLLLAFLFGLAAMILTVYLLNRTGLSRFFMYPIIVMSAIWSIYTVVLGTFVFPT